MTKAQELKKILYVEDDAHIAELTTMVLEDFGGFKVKHCFCGTEALKELQNYSPQLIIMDIMMPNMDGVEAFKRIKADFPEKNYPIIFMTAKSRIEEQEEYLKLGALGIILKPFNPSQLCKTINELWNEHKSEKLNR